MEYILLTPHNHSHGYPLGSNTAWNSSFGAIDLYLDKHVRIREPEINILVIRTRMVMGLLELTACAAGDSKLWTAWIMDLIEKDLPVHEKAF